MTTNPYAPPKADVDDVVQGGVAPPLWNPNAAAGWSLLFSPAFGAYLHMKNWQALGRVDKAATARNWLVASLAVLAVFALVSAFWPDSKAFDGLSRIVALALLLSWYFGSGKVQVEFVKTRFGRQYPRRGWALPISIAVVALLVFLVVVVAIAIAASTFMRVA